MNKQDTLALNVKNLTVSYGALPVLWDVSFSIPTGNLVAILGPNGAGKSTLLKALLGFVKPLSSHVQFLGKSYQKIRRLVAYVPQRNAVDWDFPVSVFDVVLMGSYVRRGLFKFVRKEDKELAWQALEQVGLLSLAGRQISELSGGQQQRVFLARALVQKAEIYLMDEPFAGVDVATQETLMVILKELKAKGKTILVVHHDLESVKKHFDLVLLLNKALIAAGPVSSVFHEDHLKQTFGGISTLSVSTY